MAKTYSRGGCTSCKLKKKKCDEARPLCGICARLNNNCTYNNLVFVYQPNVNASKGKIFKKVNLPTKPKEQQDGVDAVKLSIEEFRKTMRCESTRDVGMTSPHININSTSREVDETPDEGLAVPEFVKYWKDFDGKRLEDLTKKLDPLALDPKEYYYYDEHNQHVLEYIWLMFYLTRACNNYLLVTDPENYCIPKWLLHFCKTYPVIGYAITGVSSNLIAERCADLRWHKIRQRTMETGLKVLARTVQKGNSFPEMAICLLCVMFLFSERSAARSDAWRVHLKGALALVRKCDKLHWQLVSRTESDLSLDMRYALELYSFTKNWFVASETIACLSAPNGGAIVNRVELNQLLLYTNLDEQAGFVIGGFNLMKGYSQLLTPVFVTLSDIAFHLRMERGIKLSGSTGILQSGVFQNDKFHIAGVSDRLLTQINHAEAEIFDLHKILNHKLRACIRGCHLSFCAALRVFILVVLEDVPIYHPEVQKNVQKIEELLVPTSCIELSVLCVHWPIFIGALCSPPGSQRVVFLELLKTITNTGTYVARNSIDRIKRAWKCMDSGEILNEDGFDCIVL